jgi:hypothetical protein
VGDIEENPTKGIPTGRTSSIWSLPTAAHKGGDQYLVTVSLNTFPAAGSLSPVNFNVIISPIFFTPDKRKPWGPIESVGAYSENSEFPDDIVYRLSVKLGVASKQISSFFNGRIDSPEFTLVGDVLTISGSPQISPRAQTAAIKFSDLSIEEKASLNQPYSEQWFSTGSLADYLSSDSYQSFGKFRVWEPRLRQIGKVKSWSINSTNSGFDCRINSLAGFVSSNAMLYTSGAPIWNESSGSLAYQLASPHKDEAGNVNIGRYDLVLSSELIKCLWKIDPLTIQSSSVKITYDNGEAEVGVASLRSGRDWTYFSVSGFTFSNPKLELKVIGTKILPPGVTKSGTTVKKNISIQCVKGKKTIQVVGLAPKCPSGFKRKN